MAKLSEYSIGERIAYLRGLRGLKGPELARLSGVSRSTVYQIEKGEKSPTVDTLTKLAVAMNIDIAVLFATEDIHVFDMKRIPKYKNKRDLPPTLFKAFHEVMEAAKRLRLKP